VSTTPTLSWNALPGASTYELQVSTNVNFSPVIFDQAGIAGTSQQLTGLANATTYFWRVNGSNAGGTGPFSAPWSFTTEVPLFTLIPTYDKPSAGNVLNVSVSIPAGFGPTSSILYFRNGGQRAYQTIDLTINGNNAVGVIPSSFMNLRGIEYYVVVSNGTSTLRHPAVGNPANNPDFISVEVAHQPFGLTMKKQTYTMISIPMTLDDAHIGSVLIDDLGPYNTRHWRLFRWESDRLNEYPNIDSGFTPGFAFWLRTYDGRPVDADSGHSVNSRVPFQLIINPGWNQIADPFAFPVEWDSIGNSSTLLRPYHFDGTQYQPGIGVLRPWEGYFVYGDSTGPVTLSIPAIEASPSVEKTAVATGKIDPAVEYQLQLSAEATGTDLQDTYNYIGFVQGGSPGSNKLHYPEPPPIGDYVQLSIIDGGRQFMSSFKPVPTDGARWELQLRSTLPNQTVRISLAESGILPEGFKVYVFDRDSYTVVPLSDGTFSVQLTGEGSVRSMSIVIGTQTFAEGNSGGIPLTPVSFALEQNYPNPFNPTTTIRYLISRRSAVSLRVYDLLGKRVRILVDGEQTTGAYSVVWDGTSDDGTPVASGVYLCRLETGGFTGVRKLLLMK
jgi:hypothetical protein